MYDMTYENENSMAFQSGEHGSKKMTNIPASLNRSVIGSVRCIKLVSITAIERSASPSKVEPNFR